MFKIKLVSSLEKALIRDKIDSFESFNEFSALKGERVSLQLFYTMEKTEEGPNYRSAFATVKTSGELAELASLRNIEHIAVTLAAYDDNKDDNYISHEPGIYPDLLTPMRNEGQIVFGLNKLKSLWIEIDLPKDICAGKKEFCITVEDETKTFIETLTFTLNVIDAVLPENELYYTQWFYCDCLAQYYNVPMWSERHWEIVENFARCAVKCGINMLLTPVFTPALDTAIGRERLTTQLVGVTKSGDTYAFDFSLLERWIEMCDRVGIKYFEIAHFFTQWGAHYAPKVMATVDGEYKRIFGWDTDGHGEEYRVFLRAFIKSFLIFMKARGDDGRCFFHISDEPYGEHLESYELSHGMVADLLKGYPIMDALSSYEFYERGYVTAAIPASNHIEPFLEHNVPNLWTYYCCSQGKGVSNRFVSMPSWRTRFIGMQMYKYNIAGFLHWGFNYYNNRYSYDAINPLADPSGDDFAPAGDLFSVYPAQEGKALESLRALVFYDALQDVAALKLCESLYSKNEVVAEIEKIYGEKIVFDKCAYSARPIISIREKINEMIAKRI